VDGHAGAYVVFDGIDSPVTQCFGLGIFEPLAIFAIERFYFDRGAAVHMEISPFAGVAAVDLLCARNYRPEEICSVLYREVEKPPAAGPSPISVRIVEPHEAELWSDVSARGWTHEHPELRELLMELAPITLAREHGFNFLAEFDGQPGAAGVLCLRRRRCSPVRQQSRAAPSRVAAAPARSDAVRLRPRMRPGDDGGGVKRSSGCRAQGFRIAYTRTSGDWRMNRKRMARASEYRLTRCGGGEHRVTESQSVESRIGMCSVFSRSTMWRRTSTRIRQS
jgi:hypothetical protein